MEDLVIKNGLIVTPQGIVRGGLAVRKERILHIGDDDSLPKANLEVDAKGNYVLPGLVDPHIHIARATEEDFISQFRTESTSAALSGVTTFMSFVRFGEILKPRLPDPSQEWVLSADNLKSRSDYSIYEGRAVKGKAIKTFVRGKLVAEDGALVVEIPTGEYVKPLQQ